MFAMFFSQLVNELFIGFKMCKKFFFALLTCKHVICTKLTFIGNEICNFTTKHSFIYWSAK